MTRIASHLIILGLVVYLVTLVAHLELATRRTAHVRDHRHAAPPPPQPIMVMLPPAAPNVQIVDISTLSDRPELVARALHLGATERIVGIDDVRIPDEMPNAAAIAMLNAEPGHYYDLALRDPNDRSRAADRRLLVLFH